MSRSAPKLALAIAFFIVTTITAFADTYHLADFSGQINGGSANVKAPFNTVLTQGGPISGSFVYDDQLIPSSGSGFVNVFFSSFPDIALIPDATAFTLNLGGGLVFDLSNALPGSAGIQYKNGQFNGFVMASDFSFLGSPYELRLQGNVISIKAGQGGIVSGNSLVNARLNIGDVNLTGETIFVPSSIQPVPEPSSLLLLGTGLIGAIGMARRRFQNNSVRAQL